MTATHTGVPDLLRRFVPTPYSVTVAVRAIEIALQTNDAGLIAALEKCGKSAVALKNKLRATVVRDDAAPGDGLEFQVITAWPVSTILMGAGTILALDHGRCELLGFLAPAISDRCFIEQLLPTILDLLEQTSPPSADGARCV